MSELISEKNKHTIKCDCGINHVLTPDGEKIILESIVKEVKPKKKKIVDDNEVVPEEIEVDETVKPKNDWLFNYE